MEFRMNTRLAAFDRPHLLGDTATHPLARLVVRLPLSRLVAGRPAASVLRGRHTPKRAIGRVQLRFLG